MTRNEKSFFALKVVVFVAVIAISLFIGSANDILNKTEVEIQVTKTFTKRNPSSKSKKDIYMVTGVDRNGKEHSFKITDAWMLGKFNSTDIYGSIEKGKQYRFVTYGWRVPIFSWYPNIRSAEPIGNSLE